MPHPFRFVGVDVAKDSLEIFIAPEGARFTVTNDEAGWDRLIAHLAPGDAVGCEATGGYEAGLLIALAEAKLPAWCLHPSDVRAFCRLCGQRAKTDPLDVEAIAGALMVASRSRSPVQVSRNLRAIRDSCVVRRRLQADANQVKSLLSSVREETARAILEGQLDRLKHDIAVAQKAI